MSEIDDRQTLFKALLATGMGGQEMLAAVNRYQQNGELAARARAVTYGNQQAALPSWNPNPTYGGDPIGNVLGPALTTAFGGSNTAQPQVGGFTGAPMPIPQRQVPPSQVASGDVYGPPPPVSAVVQPPEAPPPPPDPNAERNAYIASTANSLGSIQGQVEQAQQRVAAAQWDLDHADPQIESVTHAAANRLNMEVDNLRQIQQQAYLQGRGAGGGPAGPSPSAIAHMQMETRLLNSQITGLDPETGLPSYAAQQAEQNRQDQLAGRAITAATGMQSRQDQLDQIANAALARSKERLMAGASNYLPSSGSFAGAPGLGVRAPSAADLMAYNPAPPTMLPEYQQAVAQALAGLASPTQGGQ